ncbi:hypothetical protein [Priestia aryabhattai]|uniref:hypothetical protein n=1 Tax=Priestia aryabhattai TaxID=412384 RepID=UPI001D0B446A|nr:hypothetical protein [Priestia aryabhattai]
MLVLCILLANNILHYIRSKNRLTEFNQREITLVTEEIAYEVENSKNSASYMEDRMAQELRTASIAIQQSLPADYRDVTNDELKQLAKKLMVSHITLLAPVEGDIIGVKSSDLKRSIYLQKSGAIGIHLFSSFFLSSRVRQQKD